MLDWDGDAHPNRIGRCKSRLLAAFRGLFVNSETRLAAPVCRADGAPTADPAGAEAPRLRGLHEDEPKALAD